MGDDARDVREHRHERKPLARGKVLEHGATVRLPLLTGLVRVLGVGERLLFELAGEAVLAQPAGAHVRPWPVRASDFDLLRHVNNAAYWYAVEDELARLAPGRAPVSAELEHRAAIEPGDPVELQSTVDDDDLLWVWLTARGQTRSAAQVRLGAPGKRHAPR